ncbi:MAG: hypothetical protein SCALA702_33410 [Melioribacteraceae bacterium]|nr:MAG: hypothetical protein SCALA702_33410 [Melioribacteraceae bacterium]
MANYKIEWKKSAVRELKKLDTTIIQRILDEITNLSINPFPSGIKKITGTKDTYRQRVGNYRIIYEIIGKRLVLLIIHVGHRKDIYKKPL